MKGKILRFVMACAVAIAALSVAAAPVAAGTAFTTCGDAHPQLYRSGENTSDDSIYGIAATIDPNTGFHVCSSDPLGLGDDQNASTAQIHIQGFLPGFITLGITECRPASSQPYCRDYNTVHWFAEVGSCSLPQVVARYDLGPADFNAHYYKINWISSSERWVLSIDGTAVAYADPSASFIGVCLNPTANPVTGGWQAETHDRGDGLGQSTSKLWFDTTLVKETLNATTWAEDSWGTSFDFCSSQHICNITQAVGQHAVWTDK